MASANYQHSADHDEYAGPDSDDSGSPVVADPVPAPGPGGHTSARGTTMDLTGEPIGHNGELGGSDFPSSLNVPLFIPRAYQLEMFEESLKRNIIVAQDTGSGKTHIAILRILHELDSAPPEKIIWFLAPTLSLCAQQHALLEEQIPAVQIKFLSGNDAIDKWRDKKLWDAVLKNVRIVVSTHQILLDALSNGFVGLDTLSLLIFDEAHNCVKSHPGSRIMKDIYHYRKAQGLPVPNILGLSASPIMNSKLESLGNIETTLDAICKTPARMQAELLQYVKMPELRQVLYIRSMLDVGSTGSLASLHDVFFNLDIEMDPYIRRLRLEKTLRSERQLAKALQKQSTYCFKQLKTFCDTSLVIFHELGAWAADCYIAQIVAKFGQFVDTNNNYLNEWRDEEKRYLSEVLAKVEIATQASGTLLVSPPVSDKVKQLISALPQDGASTVIVFAERRATVAVLAHLLSVHPLTSKLRVGTMVGTSVHGQRMMNISELIGLKQQCHTLAKFRANELDLVVATSVLEEGIDIPSCNAVICFDEPANLKSFVQRRGRARKSESKLILMQASQSGKLERWQELEAQMKSIYADDMRRLRELEKEDFEEHDGREFRVESTGALLNLDNAVAHLYHFCAVLPASQYTDRRPDFIISENEPARVILPLCLDKTVRVASARNIWRSEKNAKKDAAFQAYMSLYTHGLVDDYLMPLLRYDAIQNEFATGVEKRPSIVNASAQVNPWLRIAVALHNRADESPVWKSVVTVEDTNNQVLSSAEMVLPIAFSGSHLLRLYWDADTEMRVTVNPSTLDGGAGNKVLSLAQEQTREVLTTAFGWRLPIEKDSFVVPFMITHDHTNMSDPKRYEVVTNSLPKREESSPYLVRDTGEKYKPYVFNEYLQQKPPADSVKHIKKGYEELPTDIPYVALSSLPRRTDYLHKIPKVKQPSSGKRYSHVLPVTRCIFDKLPLRTLQFALLIPSIIYRLEGYIVADQLCDTILKDVGFRDRGLVVTAISASSTAQEINYQRLEFLGDSVLKTCTSLQVLGDNPLWHEGYLSAKKDRIVANSRLARAALHVGLDKFVLTAGFASRKWRPMYLQQALSSDSMEATREISTKVLADVVEALIGAAVIDGGMCKALACMRVFLPELDWRSLEFRREQIFERVEADVRLPSPLEPLEKLIGYTFTKKSLLIEAMTHPSHKTGVGSFERLEFLGDSVLDNIIVTTIYSHVTELSHVQMHYLRTALVNADLLAFVCMEWAATQEASDVVEDRNTNSFHSISSVIRLPLWKFMRHNSQELSRAQKQTSTRHSRLRNDICATIERGPRYPWVQLSRLQAPKFFSDIVESLLGAIYIDSGSDKFCKGVLERMGILPYLRRIIADGVRIIHPKEELGILADMEEVKYVVRLEERITDTVRVKEYICEVFVGNRSVVIVRGGVGKEEIMTKAAESAIKVLNVRSSRKCIDPDRGGYMLRKTGGEDGAMTNGNSRAQMALEEDMDLS